MESRTDRRVPVRRVVTDPAAYLAELGVRVVGVDLSPAMVEMARMRYPFLDFRVGSMVALPYRDGEWAGAVCAYANG